MEIQCKVRSNRKPEPHASSLFSLRRVLEVPYAYQCCAYGSCSAFFRASNQWEAEGASPEDEDPHRRALELFPGHADNHCK